MMRRSAKYYDKIYAAAGKNYAAEAGTIHELVAKHKLSPGRALLDVGCGTGGHMQYLQEWFAVEGLDVDADMLAIAALKCPAIKLHRANMVDFTLAREFDIVICMFSAVGYATPLAHMRQAVARMARHLAPGGVLILEPWLTPDMWQAGFVDLTCIDEPDLKLARVGTSTRDGATSVLRMDYLLGTPDGAEYFSEIHELGLYTREEYASAVRDSGLDVNFDSTGPMGRGLYTCVKPVTPKAGRRSG